MRRASLAAAATILLMVGLAACHSGSSSAGTTPTPVNNVQPVVADFGPSVNGQLVGFDNSLYTTVIICMPGTTTCQTIDHILVDTGSTGLRILSSQIGMTLPYITDTTNNLIGNCIQYSNTSYQWGPIAKVDVDLAGEVASSVPIQIVGASNFAPAPTACSAGGFPAQTALDLGANGILGVGLFRQDCGSACASSSPPAVYFSCPSSGCTVATVAVTAQLQNPVWMFPQDNNGLAIVLPQVGATGAATVTGSMIFGIGTQSNNALNSAQAQAADNHGNFTTTFNGVAYSNSNIDSGSGGFYFLDSTTTALPNCSSAGDAAGFYCPNSPVSFTAITRGPNPNGSGIPVSANVAFSVGNALTLIDSSAAVFNNLAGPNPGMFDWGLPFFFGRTVFIGIEGQSSAAGTGPYWAY
jgi:hypothetical protein